MRNNLSFRCLCFAILICIPSILNAQDFAWKSSVSEVKANGFYKILLSPNVVSKLNTQFGDIRLYDPESKEIPYILDSEKPLSSKDYFIEYKIVEKKEQTSWPYNTRIVLHNPSKNKISNIHLIIRNSDVSKHLKLSGSDDNKNWYIIKDNYRFQAMYSDNETSVIKIIDFPISNYEYYEILIDDWKDNPISIMKAGFYNTSIEKGKYSKIDSASISQLEIKEQKQSLIKVDFQSKQLIDKIALGIVGPEFYYRTAEIQIQDSAMDKRKNYEYFFTTVATINLSTSSTNTFYLDAIKAKALYIRIQNHDDQPITVKSVEAEQLNHYLICKLESSKNYVLKFGNSELKQPVYDIQYFTDKIPLKLTLLKTDNIVSNSNAAKESSAGFHLDKKFIWIAIIAVIAFLVFMITKMLKDMKNQNKTL